MDHALAVLELRDVLERVARHASSAMGREAVLQLRPVTDPSAAQHELERVRETTRLAEVDSARSLSGIPDAGAALERMQVEGGVLSPSELHSVGSLLRAGRELGDDLDAPDPPLSLLSPLRERLVSDPDVEARIQLTVERDGTVLDSASPELRRLRVELKRVRGTVVRRLESFLRGLPEAWIVSDASVTVREGRYVVPIRRDGRREVGGIVHGESATGATLFVEPPLAIELMSDLNALERAEAREIHRVLSELTTQLSPVRDGLQGSQDALIEFDSLDARARVAARWAGHPPTMLPPESREFRMVRARHPLLILREEGEVVPFDLHLDADERVLVISGPNTGGKSVFLKTVGLVSALAQCGVVPPVGPGTRLPTFVRFFADIGDEQSIEHNLSTFAAHLANLKQIVFEANDASLVLIDEMGTGTDPAEGAALATAILEALASRGALAIVTSHLGALKQLDEQGSGVVNGSLQFDSERIEPTYRFRKGRPGRSYGLAIARSLGFPPQIMDRAEVHLSEGEVRVEDLLERLERMEGEAAGLVASLEAKEEAVGERRGEVEALRGALEDRERTLKNAERSAERRAREDARRMLLDARREVERAIEEVKKSPTDELDDVSRRARQRVEQAAEQQRPEVPAKRAAGTAELVRPGDRVRITEGGATGRVVALRAGRAVVEARGGLRLEVSAAGLTPLPSGPEDDHGSATSSSRGGGWTDPVPDVVRTEADLRGLRVDEAQAALDRALDQAVLGDLPELRVIHGKGTGALRNKVEEFLEDDPRVEDSRPGGVGEGGTGVTIVRLR